MSKVAGNLLRQNAEKLAAALDPAYTAEHAAADLVSGEVAEAMRKAFEVYGNRAIHPSAFGAAQHPRMSAEQVYVLLRLCRAIRTEDRLAAMSAPSALTIVVGGDTEELSFKWAISGALLPDWMCTDRYVNEPFQIITAEMCEVNHKKHPRHSIASVLSSRNPVLLTMEKGETIPDPVAVAETVRVTLEPADRTLILWMLALLHPDTPRPELDRLRRRLPPDEALGRIGQFELLATFRAASARDTVKALRTLAQKPPEVSSGLRLAELAGFGEAKTVALQIVEDLQAWKRGELPWADVTRGLLLYGPPGTGKTELARAMAREPSISLECGNYTTWQQCGHLGDALKAMDKTFREAKANAPCVVWIDEIDSFGSRDNRNTQHQSYDIKMINGLLAHLDGIAERDGVVILAACNHPQLLDPAIKRAGRFDRSIYVGLPERDDLAIILRQYLGDDLPEADLQRISVRAKGKSGADCAAAVRNARASARGAKRAICEEDLIAALGGTGDSLSRASLEATAYHEAGHAVVAAALKVGEPSSVRLEDRGGLFSVTKAPQVETTEDMHRLRAVDLAGRAAERLIYGAPMPSAAGTNDSDIAQATRTALREELSLGLGSSGAMWFGSRHEPETLLRMPAEMRAHVRLLLDRSEDHALRILEANRPALDALATALIEQRIVADEQLRGFLSTVVDVGGEARP